MKNVFPIIVLVLLTCCGYSQTKKERLLEKNQKSQPVKILPNDSARYNMPIQKTDTYRNNMPVINADTSKISLNNSPP